MFKSKTFATLTSMLLVFGLLLTGCGNSGGSTPATEEKVPQKITYNNGAEPETIDPAKASGQPDLQIIGTAFEGLVRYDQDNKIQPGMAKEWKISEDKLTYTFTLRDTKWSNGDPVTADDFLFAWERVLNPDTASDYAYQLYYLVNAEKYNAGELKDFSQVGVKALDAHTLEVKLNAPAPQFLGLTAFQVLAPVNKKVVSTDKDWATKAESYVGNGPFKMVTWEKNQKFEFAKNDQYWDKDSVKLENLVYTSVDSETTELNMFETGQIDFGDTPPVEEMERLINDGTVEVNPLLSTYYYVFNTQAKPMDDVRVRKALAMSIDRQSIIDNILKAGQKPAFAYVPPGFPDADSTKDFREVGGDFFKEDLAEAKKLLAEAGYPDGKNFPKVEILVNNNEAHVKIAQALLEMWKENLGIDSMTIKTMEWGVYLKARDEGDYTIARAGWTGDYLDAMTFVDMYVTDGGNNDANWSSKEYDDSIATANSTGDLTQRFAAMHKAEELMINDMVVLPIYYYTNPYYAKPYVKGFFVPTFGMSVEFKWAYVEKH